jgi:hypothetical protein
VYNLIEVISSLTEQKLRSILKYLYWIMIMPTSKGGSLCSNFSFLCSILSTIVSLFGPLYFGNCLSFFGLWLQINPLESSNLLSYFSNFVEGSYIGIRTPQFSTNLQEAHFYRISLNRAHNAIYWSQSNSQTLVKGQDIPPMKGSLILGFLSFIEHSYEYLSS